MQHAVFLQLIDQRVAASSGSGSSAGITARTNVDQPGETRFLNIEIRGKLRLMVEPDMLQPLFLSASLGPLSSR